MTVTIVALLALALVGIGWVAYPLVMHTLAGGRPVGLRAPSGPPPRVSVVVATLDPPPVARARVANLRDTDLPADALQIIVAVDARAAFDPDEYRACLGAAAEVVVGDAPGGKACTLNAGVRAASGSLVAFADSHQRFERRTLPELAAAFEDPAVGAASGSYSNRDPAAPPSVLDHFWQYEHALRRAESSVHSIVAVTGCNFAIRRELWTPLPPGLLCDDLLVPLRVVMSGYRVVLVDEAPAIDPRRFTRAQEFRRKERTLTGMLQVCLWEPEVLLPWRNPVWPQFVCHKLLRLATPYLLLIAFLGLLPMAARQLRPVHLAVVIVAGLGLYAMRPALARRLVRQGAWSLSLLASPLLAGANAVRGRWDIWRR